MNKKQSNNESIIKMKKKISYNESIIKMEKKISYNELVSSKVKMLLFMIIAHNKKNDIYKFINEIRFILE
jgi:hypothetical protein